MRISDILKKEEIKRLDFNEAETVVEVNGRSPLPSVSVSYSADEIYRQLADSMRLVLNKTTKNEPVDIALVREKINTLIDGFDLNDLDLLRLIDNSGSAENYLIAHSVNVCILSLGIGKGLKYKKEQLEDLGIGAFLHDIGMVKVKKDILDDKRKLDTAEYEQVKKHADYGVEILKNAQGMNQNILAVVREHQERADGTGYPRGLALEKINEYARIVGLADVYDALTHSRPYRKRLEPFENAAIRQIISHRRLFDSYILRVFLESLTKHPAYMLWLTADGIYQVLDEYKSAIKNQGLLSQEKRGVSSRPSLSPMETGSNENGLDEKFLSSPNALVGDPESLVVDSRFRGNDTLIWHSLMGRGGKKNLLAAAAVFCVLMSAGFIFHVLKAKSNKIFYPMGESLYLAKNKLPLKIVYDFTADVSNVQSISLEVRPADLSKYYFLGLSARVEPERTGLIKNVVLRIEIENSRKEKSEYYLKGVSGSWQEFRLPLAYFDKISDWSQVTRIYFNLEPWNMNAEKGTLYVDGIRFYRKE